MKLKKDRENARNDVVSKNRGINTKKIGFYSSSTCFSARSTDDFFADSGASHHMSDQRSYFSSMTPIQKGQWLVKGIGGISLPVLGQGVEMVFTGNTVLFKHEGTVIMTGKRSGKELYHLNITVNDRTAAAVAKPKIPFSIVHQRFADLNCRAIQRMAERNVVDRLNLQDSKTPSDPCNGCIYGKMHHTPFPKGRTRATRPDKIIHSDVGGPFRIPSICGGRYYVIFQDDFSGYSEGFIIKHKSEVQELFLKFCAATKRQNCRQVGTLRTDMGKEIEEQWFTEYLAKEGILHETTASYTPQQNGMAERANRTLMEAERSIMFNNPESSLNKQKKSLLELRGPFLLAPIYVCNRSMTNTEEATPYQKYFDKIPKVNHLRVIGCR